MTEAAPFSRTTLDFLAGLLGQVTISAGAADFDEQAAVVSAARRELLAALEHSADVAN